MREVHKKSVDPAVNQLLMTAYKNKIDVAWDRADAMQPQCGFGRLSLCCTDCHEGPCRVNPFGSDDEATICGRDKHDLVAASFLKRVAAGTAALVRLADDFGANVAKEDFLTVTQGDAMAGRANFVERLTKYGRTSVAALAAIRLAKTNSTDAGPQTAEVNFGVLKTGAANVVVYGHVAPETVEALASVAGQNEVNLVAMCGNEGSGSLKLPVLTNYNSQELALLTKAVDLLVVGEQCVLPAVFPLAAKLGVPVVQATGLNRAAHVKEWIATAREHFASRSTDILDIPALKQEFQTNYTCANTVELLKTIVREYKAGTVRGIVYLGGCGNIAVTQDAHLIKLATNLTEQGYVVFTAGCAGTSLAKASLCSPVRIPARLQSVLPTGTPAVLHMGSCHDASNFIEMVQTIADSGIPIKAVIPEIAHDKVLATAVAFAANGVAVYFTDEPLFAAQVLPGLLTEAFKDTLGGAILPLNQLEA